MRADFTMSTALFTEAAEPAMVAELSCIIFPVTVRDGGDGFCDSGTGI